ncbi:hypothetical protein ACUXV3_17985 [Roseobacteraceae bacterium NS-SX3]
MNLSTLVTTVVMIGHSLIGRDNPEMLEQLLTSQAPATVEAQIINGAPLSYNWEHSARAEGIDARARLGAPADAVIVTEAIPLAKHLKWSNTEASVTQFYELARAANPDVKFYLQETWHSLDSGTGADVPFDDGAGVPWRDRLEKDLPRWQAVVDEVNAATGGTAELLPAGQALARLDDAIQAGTVPGLSSIRALFKDDIHPNDLGFYFLSLVQFGVLTGQDPSGLPRRLKDRWGKPFEAPPPEMAARLQEIAWEAAQGSEPRIALPPDPPPLPEEPPQVQLNAPVASAALAAGNGVVRQSIAMNLMPIADWSPQAPFLDHFKTARPWIGHLPKRWGGISHEDLAAAGYLDADGWPTAIPPELGSIGTVLLADLPEQAVSLSGRYVLRFEGEGIVEVAGRAENVRYGKNEVRFGYTPGPGLVDIRIQRTGLKGNYVRNITVVKEEHLAAHAAGALFNPDFLDMLGGFDVLRFMDWMDTNDSSQVGWEDRPLPGRYTWAEKGVPAEVMVALANRLKAAPWFTLPHMADDSYVRNFAQLVKAELDENLGVYAEYSNEVWNWQFDQARWADEQARARWGGKDLWMQFYGGRAAEAAQIWSGVFGESAAGRLVRVVSTQTGWLGLEEQILQAPLWVAEEPGRRAPAAYFDAYAVTGYFGGHLGTPERADVVRAWIADSRARAGEAAEAEGLRGAARAAFIEENQYDVAIAQAAAELRDGLATGETGGTLAGLLGKILPYHAKTAAAHGLDLIMYEGGSHVVGIGPVVDDPSITGFFTQLNYAPEMAALYRELLAGWAALGGRLFGAYADVAAPSKWGSWGAKRWLSDDNPRWAVLEAAK